LTKDNILPLTTTAARRFKMGTSFSSES